MSKKLRVAEFYAGTGRSYEPFRKWRKTELALLIDVNEHARATYLKNFPNAPYALADLATASPLKVANLADGKVDILIGCPPCQGFSDTGLRDDGDPRNDHITKFVNYASYLKPNVVIMENVPLAVESPRFNRMTSRLEKAGYKWTAAIVNALQYGSTQSRQRLILVAAHARVGTTPSIPKPTHGGDARYFHYGTGKFCTISDDMRGMLGINPGAIRTAQSLPEVHTWSLGPKKVPTIAETFSSLPRIGSKEALEMSHIAWDHTPQMLRRMSVVPEGGRWKGGLVHFAQTYGRLHRRGLARTVTTYFPNPGSGRFWHPTSDRTITLREAARIQGFPDDFLFKNNRLSHSATLVGNALDAALAEVAYKTARACLE